MQNGERKIRFYWQLVIPKFNTFWYDPITTDPIKESVFCNLLIPPKNF